LPDQLRAAGYQITEIGTTQRILPHAVEQRFVIGAGGELAAATTGSTRPISHTYAGIVTATVFDLPNKKTARRRSLVSLELPLASMRILALWLSGRAFEVKAGQQ
jgi:hypothetical protein